MDVWAYEPQVHITESLEWATDVQRTRRKEYRRSTRRNPRQELSYRYVLTPAQFGEAKLMARSLGASQVLVPLWTMFWRPGPIAAGELYIPKNTDDPATLTPYGTKILIWESPTNFEVHMVGINSMTPVYPYITLNEAVVRSFSSPVVIPLRVGDFAQEFEAERSSSLSVEASVRFRIVDGPNWSQESGGLYGSVTYRDRPVVTDRSLVGSGVREIFESKYEDLDSEIGGVRRYLVLVGSRQSSQCNWNAAGRASVRSLVKWIHSRRGRWKTFWLPSWNADLHVTREIQDSDTTIEVTDVGMRTRASFPLDLMLETKAGARVFVRVTSAAAGSQGKEILTLGGQVGSHIYTWEVSLLSVLSRCRFDSDRIELSYGSAETVSVSAPIVEVPE